MLAARWCCRAPIENVIPVQLTDSMTPQMLSLVSKGPVLFLTGFILGILVTYYGTFLFNSNSINRYKQLLVPFSKADFSKDIAAIQKAQSSLTQSLFDSVRILCWVMTQSRVKNRQAIMETWGARCQTLLFILGDQQAPEEGKSEQLAPNTFIIRLQMQDVYGNLWNKTRLAFRYIAKNYNGTFDWVLKIDDDSYVVMENLRLFLSRKNQTNPQYYGVPYKVDGGYNSGGPGYVLSAFYVDRIFGNGSRCQNHGSIFEDVEMGKCLKKIGVKTADTRDKFGRFRWSPFEPMHTMFHETLDKSKMNWFNAVTAYEWKKGFECCSDEFISFHYISSNQMRVMDYLIYDLHPFSSRGQTNSTNANTSIAIV